MSRYLSVPLAAIGVSLLVLRGNFRHVEHVLLALSSVFVAYVISGVLAHPDWGAAAKGLVVPEPAAQPRGRAGRRGDGRHDAGAVGPGLHPVLRGRQEAARQGPPLRADRRDRRRRADRRDRLLRRRRLRGDAARPGHRHQRRQRRRPRARTAGRGTRRRPSSASASSAPRCWRRRSSRSQPPTRSRRPSAGRPTSTTASRRRASFYLSYGVVVIVAAVLVLIPGAPLIPILFLSQALNAVLLLVLLPFMRSLGQRPRADGRATPSGAGTGSRPGSPWP